MKNTLILILTISVFLLAFAGWALAAGDKPYIDDLTLKQGQTSVLLSAKLVTRFDDEMRKAMRGGVPLSFSFSIRLTRKGSIIGEKIVRRRQVVHTLEFDPVKQQYVFKGEGYGREPLVKTTKDEDEAIRWLTGIVDWSLYPLDKLEENVRYRVRVMATLRSVELPSVLGYLFFFTTIFNEETPWVQLDFTF